MALPAESLIAYTLEKMKHRMSYRSSEGGGANTQWTVVHRQCA